MIDKSKIKVGDKVKVAFTNADGGRWISDDFVTVTGYSDGYADNFKANGYYLAGLEVIEHKPNFKPLEDAVTQAEEALAKAKAELDNAKNPFKIGTRVTGLSSGFSGTVVACPREYSYMDNPYKVWVMWDVGFDSNSPKWSSAQNLKVAS